MSAVSGVPPEKIQVFFSTGSRLTVKVHMVADLADVSSLTDQVTAALSHARFLLVEVETYAPDRTARGGVLRQPRKDSR
ncbi:hypothetical protein VSS74_23990 [Conexibacter stalactiti]|uniref:Uncharacterized protein n=1 Tax=Conexibacter stalactiti TaxID=1940611 RepID=A0ABU4HVY3_9ACTN|nr:hypothetical protein [Conexibacter stalactiti]MDW5597431.1 hypothetical protein [Conexibacter stalactiti]MEC5038073.1 hypothetical protein [Conexibacter stalactiti]